MRLFELSTLIMFQVFMSFNVYDNEIFNFTLITEIKLMTLFLLLKPEAFRLFFGGFCVGSNKSFIIYVE